MLSSTHVFSTDSYIYIIYVSNFFLYYLIKFICFFLCTKIKQKMLKHKLELKICMFFLYFPFLL